MVNSSKQCTEQKCDEAFGFSGVSIDHIQANYFVKSLHYLEQPSQLFCVHYIVYSTDTQKSTSDALCRWKRAKPE